MKEIFGQIQGPFSAGKNLISLMQSPGMDLKQISIIGKPYSFFYINKKEGSIDSQERNLFQLGANGIFEFKVPSEDYFFIHQLSFKEDTSDACYIDFKLEGN